MHSASLSKSGQPFIEFDEKKIDAIFGEVNQCHLPGAAVGIALGGKTIYRKGFGLANMELPVGLSPAMRMRIASTTKHFTALAYMLLCEEGKAGIDDPVATHLPELHPIVSNISIRQLMGNISGLRDAHDISWQFSGRQTRISSAELMSMYRDIDDVNALPGAAWIYCNGGFLILSAAIERISGKPLADVFNERIFRPVGMYDTLLRRWDADFVPNSATLHTMAPLGAFDRTYLGSELAGEGGVVSTVDDMLRWLAHMDAPEVGSAPTWATMKTSQTLTNGIRTGYGLGLACGEYRGIETLYHAGGVMGGNSQMLKVPIAGLDIVVMVNRSDVSAILLANRVLDVCLPALAPPRNAPGGAFASGVFRSVVTGRVVELSIIEGRQIASIDGVDFPLAPDSDGVLWPVGTYDGMKLAVTLKGGAEKPTSIHLDHYGNCDELPRAQPAAPAGFDSIAGRYRSAAIDTEVRISDTGDGPQLVSAGRFGSVSYRLACLAEGIWRTKSAHPDTREGICYFARDGASFQFSNDRTWALRFRRVG